MAAQKPGRKQRLALVVPDDPGELAQILGLDISPEALRAALIHRSYAFESGGITPNERLEFLGDSVLGLVVTDRLYRAYPDLAEGRLARMRSAVVNSRALADVARGLGLGRFLFLGRGEESTGGRDKTSILADTTEAVIGAVYLELGLDVATDLIHRLFDPVIAEADGLGAALDWKTSLQELAAGLDLGLPDYRITEEGPDHAKNFSAAVVIAGREYPPGLGRTKKAAEQLAARAAYRALSDSA